MKFRGNIAVVRRRFQSVLTLAGTIALFIILLLICFSSVGRLSLQIPLRPFLILSGSMNPIISEGSVVFVKQEVQRIGTGDIVTFKRPNKPWENVTHRVVGEQIVDGQTRYRVKGDANNGEDPLLVPQEAILGKVIFSVPGIGYLLNFSKTRLGIILFFLLPLLVIALEEIFLIFFQARKTHKKSAKRKIAFLVMVLIFLLFSPSRVEAADLQVTCSGSSPSCAKIGLEPLFSSLGDGLWYPGRCIVRVLNLKNASSRTRQIAIQGRRSSPMSSLENVMRVSIYPIGESRVTWSGNLADFYSASSVNLGIFESWVSHDYSFSLCMDSAADNSYRNLQSVFDLTVGFWEEVGAGGVSLPSGASAPSCDDKQPGSAPVLISAVSLAGNRVVLKWSKALDPVTYYLVAYGLKSSVLQYGNPNVGGSGTTSYVVGGLSSGVVYYFRVRAGNGCMPGDYSNEISVSVPGKFLQGPATGFFPGVLGTETPRSAIATPTEEVKKPAPSSQPWISTPVLLLLMALTGGVIYLRFFRKWR